MNGTYSRMLLLACGLAAVMAAGAVAETRKAGAGQEKSGGTEKVIGTWEGESKCTAPDSPCHDEHVIYEIAAAKSPAKGLTMRADKVVNGERQFMGELGCEFDAEKSVLSCTFRGRQNDDWEFTVSGDTMTGTLTVGEKKQLYRRVRVERKTK